MPEANARHWGLLQKLFRRTKTTTEERKEGQKMTLEEFKCKTSETTGIPVNLLEGETGEEVVSRAKMLYALKQKNDVIMPQQKTCQEQFADWFKQYETMKYGEEEKPINIFEGLTNTAREVDGLFPSIPDTSIDPLTNGMTGETPEEQFALWFKERTAYDPLKNGAWNSML